MADLSSIKKPITGSVTLTGSSETFTLPEWCSYFDVYVDDTAAGTYSLNGGGAALLPHDSWVRVYERPVRLRADFQCTVTVTPAGGAGTTVYYALS